jgi:PAS domain S-box-containing protein
MSSDFRLRTTTLRSPAAQYAFALLVLAVSTGFRTLLNPALGNSLPYIFYFVAVAVVSITCDLYPAVVELIGSALLANLLFRTPQHQFTFGRALIFDVLYLISGAIVVYAGQAHRRSAKALREQKDWLHTTLTSVGDAVIATDADGLIIVMNRVAEELTGWSLKESRSKPLAEVFRIFNQDTRQTVENPMEKVRRLHKVVGLANHTILVSKSGEEIPIDDSGAPIFAPDGSLSGIVLVFRDVTEQRKAQRVVAELAAIVEYSGDAIATKNLDGIIQTWNTSAEQLFGYKREEIVGKPVTVLIPPDRLDEETEILQRIRAGRPSERLETIRLAKGGRAVHVSVCVSPIKDAEGYIIGASKVVHDITELAVAREAVVREKEFLATTIASIGDAVIATDAQGQVMLMNRVAEALTGWPLDEARGKPLAEVFRIVNQETRQTVENPVDKVRRLNTVVGLANHTLLISKSGQEIAIDDSGAPIFSPDGALAGIVLVFRDVTEARKAEAKLRAQAALLDLAWDAIIVRDELGYIKFWNRGAEELYGWSREEALGKTTHELIRTQFPVPLPEIITQTRENKRWQGELVHTTKSGRQVTVLSRWGLLPAKNASGVPDLMETNTDITRRKQDEEQIRKQREWFLTTLTSIGDAVIATDPDGLITLMNPVAEKLTEWKSEEAVGKPLTDVFRIVNQETRQSVESPVEKVRRLNNVVGLANHTVLMSKSGQEFAIDDSGAPIRDANGKIVGIVLIFRDVTQQRALEIALKSNERLALAGRLSASIAHEIHNPLDIVNNALFLLEQQVRAEPKTRLLIETAQREVKRVFEISKNMLSLHRESRTASKVNLFELLQGVVSLIQETIAKGRRKIEFIPGFKGEVEAFPSELRQVFTNVIKNAVEATTDGGNVKIYSEAAEQSGQDGVLIRVVDDGVGVPEQLRARLFNPFVTTKEESGTGLGLWVSRSIVERHGGSIRLDGSTSASSSGTTVVIFLPLKPIFSKDDSGIISNSVT